MNINNEFRFGFIICFNDFHRLTIIITILHNYCTYIKLYLLSYIMLYNISIKLVLHNM